MWFPCPGCDRMVTAVVQNCEQNRSDFYSSSHCCLDCQCQAPNGHAEDPWACAGVPRHMFKEIWFPGLEAPAHYLLHDPGPQQVQAGLPALLFLHGSHTYLYPETLWWHLRDLIDKNNVAREQFIIVAPLAAIGEPLARVSSTRMKPNRFWVDEMYVEGFHEDRAWHTFLGAVKALGPGRVDMCKLHVLGFSMGGQAAWNIAIRHGSKLASMSSFAGCCSWPSDAWAQQSLHFAELCRLKISCYCGKGDHDAVSWRDFWWLAGKRGL